MPGVRRGRILAGGLGVRYRGKAVRFVHNEIVRFAHVDAAGIVFYPRYFEMLNATIEAWFAEALNYPFEQMVGDGCGVPLIHSAVSFTSASRLGERLRFGLAVSEVGRSRVGLSIACDCDDETRLTADFKLVLVQLRPLSSKRLPDPLRAAMLNYLEPSV